MMDDASWPMMQPRVDEAAIVREGMRERKR